MVIETPDGGDADAGSVADAGGTDDAGMEDGGMQDAGMQDAGVQDAGAADGGPDGGVTGPGRIDHLVVIVLENHTFDNLFANFPDADTRSHFDYGSDVFDAPHAPDNLSRDLCHGHGCALTDWNGGAMDGWLVEPSANQNGDHLAWAQYRREDIPGFWHLAERYGLADHFFSSMLGPSFPGHTFLLAGQSGWALDNPDFLLPLVIWGCDDPQSTRVNVLTDGSCTSASTFPCFDIPSAPDVMRADTTWKFYGTGVDLGVLGSVVWSMFDAVDPIRHTGSWDNVVPYGQFESDVQNGTLPNVSWLVDQDLDSGHPPLSMCASSAWATHYTNLVINSPYWSNSAVIITYDDFGGFYDHVPPPEQYGCDADHPYGLGFRLPAILVSPWVKPGVFHGVTEQASVVRLVEELFGDPGAVGTLHALDPAARDDVAGSLLDAFDFNQQPLPPAPGPESCP